MFKVGRAPSAKLAHGVVAVTFCIKHRAEVERLKGDVAFVVHFFERLYRLAHDAVIEGIDAFYLAQDAHFAVYKGEKFFESGDCVFGVCERIFLSSSRVQSFTSLSMPQTRLRLSS